MMGGSGPHFSPGPVARALGGPQIHGPRTQGRRRHTEQYVAGRPEGEGRGDTVLPKAKATSW